MKKWRTIIIGLAIMFFGLLCPSIESEAAREFTFIYSKCTKTYDGTNDIVLYWVPGTKNPAEFDLCYYDGWGADGAFYQGNRDISDSPIKSIDYKKGKMVLDGAWGISLAKYSDDYLSLGMWVDDGSEDGKYDFWDVKYNFKKYAGKRVTVTFDPNGGTVSQKSKKVTFAKPYGKLPTPTRKGYSFVSWYTLKNGGYRISGDSSWDCSPAKNHTLYARWQLKKFNITYNFNGGSKISGKTYPATYTMKKEIVLPKATRKGYTFAGWYTDKNFKNKITKIEKGSTGNKTLYAKWKANTYKVAFKANGGTGTKMTDQSFTYNAAKKALKANTYTKKGYKFVGWATSASGKVVYTNKQQVRNLTTTNNKTITLYAKWEIAKYTISYKAVPETPGISFADSQKTYTIKQSITLKKPTLKGYTLTGKWYSDKACTKAVSTTIEKGKTGNKTYYYKIISKTPIKYTIVFDGNGATSGTMDSIKNVKYDQKVVLPNNDFKKTGYAFKGWRTSLNGAVKYEDGAEIKNLSCKNNEIITLYACWELITDLNTQEIDCTAYFKSVVSEELTQLDYKFSNLYFSNDSDFSNRKIAKASICLSSSAYKKAYIVNALEALGFEEIETFNYNKVADMGDNDFVAYTIAKKHIIVDGVTKNLVAVVIRGTTGNAEWYSNLNMGKDTYHQGFYLAAKEIQNNLIPYLGDYESDDNLLWVTGHSRGAAVANIVAGEYTVNDKYSYYVQPQNIFGYTFACPAVSKAADTSLTNIYNFCNKGDIVTQLPLENWGFKRFGKTLFMDDYIEDMKVIFREVTGENYKGLTKKGDAIDELENWIPTVDEFYDEKSVETPFHTTIMSKHQLMNAVLIISMIKNETEQESDMAWSRVIDVAIGENMEFPKACVAMYVGEATLSDLLNGERNLEAASPMSELTHSHCQDLYYSWMCAYCE